MITELVPCGNPNIKELISVLSRSVRTSDHFKPHVKDGQKYCSWCWVKPFKHPRKLYCSDECRQSCNLFCYPQTEAGLHFLIISRGAKCEKCSYSWQEKIEAARAERITGLKQYIDMVVTYSKKIDTSLPWKNIRDLESGKVTQCLISKAKFNIEGNRRPEIDHIIPVALGGTTLGFENLQLLCCECHKTKTKQDMVEIRGSRRKS